MTWRIGVDTGGTHTDVVLIGAGEKEFITLKVPTTPQDHSVGVMDGVRKILSEARLSPESIGAFAYGTTVVTNLLITRDADVAVGLITTAGFRDAIEIGRAARGAHVYDIHWRPQAPLVPRHLRFGVTERIDFSGRVITQLDEDDLRGMLKALADAGVESIAICFLNAYANPAHERRAAEIAAEVCPGVEISLSSEVARQFREYERTSTTVVNAFVRRPITRHLSNLSDALKKEGVVCKPYIMRANGGLMTFDAASRLPAAIVHSGPTAGVIAGTVIAECFGIRDFITFDMGGTSTDVSLITDGKPVLTSRGMIEKWPVVLPMLDLVTVGAGGGSIAWVDDVGGLKVGPRSAGAMPGPACYDQGGVDPTITDANLLTGRLNPDYFLGGAKRLRFDLSEASVRRRVAEPLGMPVHDAARGIIAIAEAHMVNAIKQVSTQRGFDPRDFTLVAFGGCGPLHAVALAEELEIGSVLVPPAPGNVSAMGQLAGNIRHDFVLTKVAALDAVTKDDLSSEFGRMVCEGDARLADEGVDPSHRQFLLSIDLCYKGQNFELSLALPSATLDDESIGLLPRRFHEKHRQTYGYALPTRPIKLVNLRVAAVGRLPGLTLQPVARTEMAAHPNASRSVVLSDGARVDVPLRRVETLGEGDRIPGPAIVEYSGSTLFILPEWTATYDRLGIARIARGGD